jgi:hypothetical protein
MHTTTIYCLIDPRSGEIRYVGKADEPQRRLRRHLRDKRDCHRTAWIRSLAVAGVQPAVVPLEHVAKSDWQTAERRWIQFMRANGADLVNGTDGGDGGRMRPEARAKQAARMRGRATNPAGWKHTPEARSKLSESHKGKAMLPQTRAAIRAAIFGKKWTTEQRARLSKVVTGRSMSAETRTKISQAFKGKKHPLDCKHCAALRARYGKEK